MSAELVKNNNKIIAIWLFSLCALIILMIMVGGATRLTGSGLSMVRWEPISGIIPPLNEAEWQAEFEHYKQYPQFIIENHYMDLAEFKKIFHYEYGHRVLGRIIGFWLLLPLIYFWARGKIERSLLPKLLFMFFLGGLQGLVGWWMVKSGLSDNPDVSQYRLAIHLALAVFIYIYIFSVALGLVLHEPDYGKQIAANRVSEAHSYNLSRKIMIMVGLIYLQMILGAFVAGLNAGFTYNNWPMMGDKFIADGLFEISPIYLNFFENIALVQLDHRLVAYFIFFFAIYLFFNVRGTVVNYDKSISLINILAILSVITQVILGILTLIYVVPVSLGVIHQGFAMVVLSLNLLLYFKLKLD